MAVGDAWVLSWLLSATLIGKYSHEMVALIKTHSCLTNFFFSLLFSL